MKNRMLKLIAVGFVAIALTALPVLAGAGADIIAHDAVTEVSLSKAAIKDILLGKTTFWKDGQAIVLVVANDKMDAALQELAGMSASQFKTHWQRLAFSGRGQQPKIIAEADVVSTVASTKGAIGIVPEGAKLAGVKKVEVK